VTVDPVVILNGLNGASQNFATGVNALGDVGGESGGHVALWSAGSTTATDVGLGRSLDINNSGQQAGEFGGQAALWTPDGKGGYTLTRIGDRLPSPILSAAYGINSGGQVVGMYRVWVSEGVWGDKCFVWTPDAPNSPFGSVETLPGLGGNWCVANDINSTGYVVGTATRADGEGHGFIWTPPVGGVPGRMQDLTPKSGDSYATSINDLRQVAGQHVTKAGAVSAAIFKPAANGSYTVTDIGTFTGNQALAMDINDAGFVVGWARHVNSTDDDAFLWQNGEFTLLPGLTSVTEATAMTALNGNTLQVVGGSVDPATNNRTAVRWNVTFTPKK
jgi:probable HAF family extracellular repeat protein